MHRQFSYERLLRIGFIGLALAQIGCATTSQVRTIVENSNAAIVASSFSSSALDPAGTSTAGAAAEVQRIDEFIAAHPDQAPTVNALRVRQGVLLLTDGKPNMARVALDQVDPSQLFSDRDRAIYNLREQFIWWWQVGGSTTTAAFTPNDRARADAAVTAIDGETDDLPKRNYTRRFLEQMRMRIALRWARSLSDSATIHPILESASTKFADQFEESEKELIQRWRLRPDEPLASASLSDLRWYDYVPTAFEQLEDIWRRQAPASQGQFTPSWVACILETNCTFTSPDSP